MKLQQLRFLAAVAQNDLNITAAASKLCTTQPAVSKQLRLLEQELGFSLFVRSGRALAKATAPGQRVIEHAFRILRETQNIKGISAELKDQSGGALSIGTTHTQARYALPPVIKEFRTRYPRVKFHLHQGTSEQIAEMAERGRVDIAIATGSASLFSQFVLLPCYRWYRRIIVPASHPLASVKKPTLEDLAAHPIVTYVFSFAGPASLNDVFAANGLHPQIALTARDADVIKTYVRLGLGAGIVANMSLEGEKDADLVQIDASHLFPIHTTWTGFTRGMFLRGYVYDFLQLIAPHLTRDVVDRARSVGSQAEVDALFGNVALPLK